MTGLYVLLVVLTAATLFGLWRRRTDGRMRPVPLPTSDPPAGRPAGEAQAYRLPIGGGPTPDGRALDGSAGGGRAGDGPAGARSVVDGPAGARSVVDGRVADGTVTGPEDDSEPLIVDGHPIEVTDHTVIAAADVLDPADLGQPLGARATLLQFSSAFCAPCRATRVVLGDVARMVGGVAHIEVDAESHLDLVRLLDVTRTPTVLVLDATGRIRSRATGAPRRADVIAALGGVI